MDRPDTDLRLSGWALILGASSGFGEATALMLARRGMDIAGVHLDRRATMPNVERIVAAIREAGRQAAFFNVNAADESKRRDVIAELSRLTEGQGAPRVRVLLHSLAFGTLRPYIADPERGTTDVIGKSHMDMTSDVMGHSLVYWVQDLVAAGLLSAGSRIFAMTSAGGRRVMPHYGAVSAAKAALESHIRQLAYELSPRGITANALCAGVTDTPALRKIPGHEKLIETALARNPAGRLTRPEDVAAAVVLLAHPLSGWITGNVINVDGGEDIAG
jgi:NAD(P)-dependent dehydrogenase (short-subunit alcohol dehydrogenase family)